MKKTNLKISIFVFFSFMLGCNSSINVELSQEAEGTSAIFLAKTAPNEINLVNSIELKNGEMLNLFALNENYSKTSVQWSMSGSMASLTILPGGEQAELRALSLGVGSVEIEFDGKIKSYAINVSANTASSLSLVSHQSNSFVNLGTTETISWTDNDDDSDAQISIFLTENNSGACSDGTLLTSGISEDAEGAGDSYDLDTTSLNDGIYYLCLYF
jgi:hypothetical protein